MKPMQDARVFYPMKPRSSLLRFAFVVVSLACASVAHAQEKPADDRVPPSVLKKYDRNKDGVLDESERAKWEEDKAAAREKYRKQREELLEKYDTNKDGRLSEEERAAAKIGMERVRTEREGEKMRERAAKAEQEAKDAAAKDAQKTKTDDAPASSDTMMGGSMMMAE